MTSWCVSALDINNIPLSVCTHFMYLLTCWGIPCLLSSYFLKKPDVNISLYVYAWSWIFSAWLLVKHAFTFERNRQAIVPHIPQHVGFHLFCRCILLFCLMFNHKMTNIWSIFLGQLYPWVFFDDDMWPGFRLCCK